MFVSSHLLAEIEQVCDHLVMIQGGRLVYQGSVDELAGDRGVAARGATGGADQVDLVFAVVRSTGRHAEIVGDEVVVEAEPGWAGDLNRLAMGMGVTLVHLTERRRSLEDAFLELTGSASSIDASRGGRTVIIDAFRSEWVKLRRPPCCSGPTAR